MHLMFWWRPKPCIRLFKWVRLMRTSDLLGFLSYADWLCLAFPFPSLNTLRRYYSASVGEEMASRYRVEAELSTIDVLLHHCCIGTYLQEFVCKVAIGRGVFSSVYHCKGLKDLVNQKACRVGHSVCWRKDSKDYAIKLIRANAMMRRCADKEAPAEADSARDG